MNKKETIAKIIQLVDDVYAHFDKIIFQADSDISFLDLERLTNNKAKGAKAKINVKKIKKYSSNIYVLTIFQPSREILNDLITQLKDTQVNLYINFIEITYDFLTDHPEEIAAIINRHLVYLRRGGEYFNNTKGTHYWGNKKLNHPINIVSYIRKSKVAHTSCYHLEFILCTKEQCVKNALAHPSQLINFDFKDFFSAHSRFYAYPNKKTVGKALAEFHEVEIESDRGLEKYYDRKIKIFTKNNSPTIQELLSLVPIIKSYLHTKKAKIVNDDFTSNMQKCLLKKLTVY